MKSKTIALMIAITLPLIGHATDVQITVDDLDYPSPATVHLINLQDELARKAIAACGSQDNVEALSDISINIQNGIAGNKVASIIVSKSPTLALELIYPHITASATVSCL